MWRGFRSRGSTSLSRVSHRKDTSMTRILPVLCVLVLAVAAVAQIVRGADDHSASKTPTITGTLEGSRAAVFETPKDSCNQNDIPDSMARAFRDFTGMVHLVAASS